MSIFNEYLDIIPKALSNAPLIVEGVVNNVRFNHGKLPQDQQDEIIRRRLICEACPLNSVNAKFSAEYKELYGKSYETERKSLHCAICTCNITKKTASLASSCGLEYYNSENPHKPQELKWTAYQSKTK